MHEGQEGFTVYAGVRFLDVVQDEFDSILSSGNIDFFSNSLAHLEHIVNPSVTAESLLFFVHERFRKLLYTTSDDARNEFAPYAEEGDSSLVTFVAAWVFLFPEWDNNSGQDWGQWAVARSGGRYR